MKLIVLILIIASFNSFSFEETENFADLSISEIFKVNSSDDPRDYPMRGKEYNFALSPILWPLGKYGENLSEISLYQNNTDSSVEFLNQRIFLAFRSAKKHGPSKTATLYVLSSLDGKNWELEWKKSLGLDLFHPRLVVFKNELHLFYVVGGTSKKSLDPYYVERVTRFSKSSWSNPIKVLTEKEIPYEFKVRNNTLWLTSYTGKIQHIRGQESQIQLQLKKSDDGLNFYLENEVRDQVALGGATETSIEFDSAGNIWGVSKNFDGDLNGFGSYFIFAPGNLLSYWTMKEVPKDYFSPKVFRQGKDFYVIARRSLSSKNFSWVQRGSVSFRRLMNWSRYLFSPKTTALYKLNKENFELDWVMDLPGSGDTGQVQIRRVSENSLLLTNHTSSLLKTRKTFRSGRNGPSQIYFMSLQFKVAP